MRKRILVYALVLVAAIALVGCNNGSSDSLLKIQFNGPGVMTTNGRYALTDHEYTAGEYSVVAYYSNGTKDVTKDAKITSSSSNVEIGSGNTLKFTDPNSDNEKAFDNENDHKFPLVIEYGGKKLSAEVVAYGAGEAIGGLKNPKTQLLPSEIVSSNIAGIAYLTKDGSYVSSSSSLPSSGYFIYADSEAFYITTVGEGFEYRNGIVPTILYLTYIDFSEETGKFVSSSRQVNLKVESLDPSSIQGGRVGILPFHPTAGEEYDSANFAKLFKEMKVVLKDVDGNNHVMYATDEDGNAKDPFSVDISVVDSDDNIKTTDKLVSGDKIKVNVKYKTGESSSVSLNEKVYPVSNRR